MILLLLFWYNILLLLFGPPCGGSLGRWRLPPPTLARDKVRCIALLWWQRRHGDRKICSICDIDRDGVTARCGQCDGDTAICPISIHYTTFISTYLHISTHSDLSDISVITQPSPPRQLPDIVSTNYMDLILCSKLFKIGFPCYKIF